MVQPTMTFSPRAPPDCPSVLASQTLRVPVSIPDSLRSVAAVGSTTARVERIGGREAVAGFAPWSYGPLPTWNHSRPITGH